MDAKTKSGKPMRDAIRRRVLDVLGNIAHDRLTQEAKAKIVGVSSRTLRDYLTPEMEAEIKRVRHGCVTEQDLLSVDRAMLERAREGSVAAARLLYMRVAKAPELHELPSLEEIERELQELKKALE